MVAYLAVHSGPEKGRQFLLDPARPMHIGRGVSCEIVLTDPVSSRFHAVVFREDGGWHLRDTSSRNGTLVNGQKTDHARLIDQSVVRIGETELRLIESEPSLEDTLSSSQTLLLDGDDEPDWRPLDHELLSSAAQTGHVLDLYQLSLMLLRSDTREEVDEIIHTVLDFLRGRTDADMVVFYFGFEDGQPQPQMCLPAELQSSAALSRKLVRRIVQQGKSLWITQDSDPKLRADACGDGSWTEMICVPMNNGLENVGVLQLQRTQSRFTEDQFDLVVAAASLLGVSLRRASEHDSLRAERAHLASRNAEGDELIGNSQVMQKLKERIRRIGRATGSVLIRGESGSGKELVARAVHACSRRSQRPMLTVNCAAIPQDLIESQLFGHKKGAFTGAEQDHVGWFQQAHTGTLFLDEIGELTLAGQAKLLRILEGHPFLPVGASEEVLVDVRVLAATNRDLAEFVREGRFREDLFYRLSVFELLVPPLRDRDDDIDLLVDHFLDHFRRQHGRPGLGLGDDARFRLREYAWPGNVRQLRNVVDSAVVMADDPAITADDLGLRDAGTSRLDTLRIDQWEQRLIRKALQRAGGSVPAAAKLLGISRATAYRKISEYEIER